jgi:hypothetical protein
MHSNAWANKMLLFFYVFSWDKILLFFWNLHFAHAEEQGQLKKEDLMVSLILLPEGKMGLSPMLLCYAKKL